MTLKEIEALMVGEINNVEFIQVLPGDVAQNLQAFHYFRDKDGRIRAFQYFTHRNIQIKPGIYCLKTGRETYEEFVTRTCKEITRRIRRL